jgi:hypothetical protein
MRLYKPGGHPSGCHAVFGWNGRPACGLLIISTRQEFPCWFVVAASSACSVAKQGPTSVLCWKSLPFGALARLTSRLHTALPLAIPPPLSLAAHCLLSPANASSR